MKITNYFLFTSKNNYIKNDDYIYNNMVKGGFIRKLSSGIYILLPNGFKVINNLIRIIRFYMNNIGAVEMFMPIIQPLDIWKKSNRYIRYGKELFLLNSRNKKKFVLSPTHEECITKLICEENINRYFFPKIFYQINTKFRDEIRPKYNFLRSKEFIMKDAYSFHDSIKCLDINYYKILNVYKNIFKYLGLNIFYKKADCGIIGGCLSHEFHILSKYGENILYLLKNKNIFLKKNNKNKYKRIKLIKNINFNNEYNLNKFIDINKFVKTFLLKFFYIDRVSWILIMIPYEKKINFIKLYKIFPFVKNIILINKNDIKINFNYIFFGPFNFNYQIIADYSLFNFKNFIIGANKNNSFYFNVNWFLNIGISGFYDICNNFSFFLNKNNKDRSIKYKSIEIAHIFQLSNYYYNFFSNKNILCKKNIYMGCYGIGITRLFFSIIDYYSSNKKIVLPLSISHFKLGILPINMYKCDLVKNFSFKIYYELLNNNIDVLLDDRKLYFGEMLTDFEVMGVPNILIISKRNILYNLVEFIDRINNLSKLINKNRILDFLLLMYKNFI